MFKEPAPRGAQQLVDEQVRRWEQGEKRRTVGEVPDPWPLITVSREFGALGTATGERAAKKLGFQTVDTIDDDLGVTASGQKERPGFERLFSEVASGRVGAVFCIEASRLARTRLAGLLLAWLGTARVRLGRLVRLRPDMDQTAR